MHKDTNLIRKLFSFYKPYKVLFTADILCALGGTATGLALPLCTRVVTKDILGGNPALVQERILRVGAVMLGLILLQTLCAVFYDHMGHVMGARMERDMRTQLFSHLQKLPMRFFDDNRTGSLMSRVTNDLLTLAELCHHGPEDLMIYLVRFLGALVILLRVNMALALVVSAFLPIMIAYSLLYSKRLKRAYRTSYQRIADVNAQLEDSLSGIRVVKSFAGEEEELGRFQAANQRYCDSRCAIYKHEAYYFSVLTYFFAPLITLGVVVAGGMWIATGSLDIPDLLTFLLYVGYLTAPIPRLAQIVQQYQDGLAGFRRFMEIIDTPAEQALQQGDSRLPAPSGHVRFEGVSFRYGEELSLVLQDITLDIRPGETVAFVGSSGVGKTTLCSLIPGFYRPTAGRVLLDGTDVADCDLASLRRQVGVVQQDVYLFADSVLANIRYGRPEATEEEVVEAARMAGAHEFIEALPQGYHTAIGQRGVKLSGGQRQRLCIARVFLKNPPVLIFDEATSALDTETEQVVQRSLDQLSRGRTTLIIAHRLSTVRRADRIIVLTGQGLGEQGTHEELLAMGGQYAALYSQLGE